jgi:hypothetical protein
MFPKLTTFEFVGTNLDKNLVGKMFGQFLPTGQIQGLECNAVEWTDPSADIFEGIHRVTQGFRGIKAVSFVGCKLQADSFAFLTPEEKIFDPVLVSLKISDCPLTDEGLATIFGRLNSPRLRNLTLSKTTITSTSLRQIPNLEKLEVLNIADNQQIDQFLTKLSTPKQVCGLRSINVANCGLSPGILPLFIGNLKFIHLEEVTADQNPGTFAPFISALQGVNLPSNLRNISMKACGIKTQELIDIAALSDHISLQKVDISGNPEIDFAEVLKAKAFERTQFWASIGCLSLQNETLTETVRDTLVDTYGINIAA